MSTTTTAPGVGSGLSPAGAFSAVLNATVGSAAAKLEERVGGWTDKLNGVAAGGASSGGLAGVADEGLDYLAEGGGAKEKAGAEGVKAGLHGKNPVWAAIKGAWQAGTPVVKAAIVAAVANELASDADAVIDEAGGETADGAAASLSATGSSR